MKRILLFLIVSLFLSCSTPISDVQVPDFLLSSLVVDVSLSLDSDYRGSVVLYNNTVNTIESFTFKIDGTVYDYHVNILPMNNYLLLNWYDYEGEVFVNLESVVFY